MQLRCELRRHPISTVTDGLSRAVAIRVVRCYRIVSAETSLVITSMVPGDLLAEEEGDTLAEGKRMQ